MTKDIIVDEHDGTITVEVDKLNPLYAYVQFKGNNGYEEVLATLRYYDDDEVPDWFIDRLMVPVDLDGFDAIRDAVSDFLNGDDSKVAA